MKNISFVNIGSIILIVFFVIFTTSIQESQEKTFYESLPRVENVLKVKELPKVGNALERVAYRMHYVGPPRSEIKIDGSIFLDSEIEYVPFDLKEKKHLDIVVDTTQLIYKSSYDNGFKIGSANPVFIYNLTKKNQNVGFGDLLHMVMEAKDEKGNWKPIEKQAYYFCGTGMEVSILERNQVCVSSVYKYSGDFKTKLRLRHLGNYSNEFEGSVNLDEFGEYDTEAENSLRVIKKINP